MNVHVLQKRRYCLREDGAAGQRETDLTQEHERDKKIAALGTYGVQARRRSIACIEE